MVVNSLSSVHLSALKGPALSKTQRRAKERRETIVTIKDKMPKKRLSHGLKLNECTLIWYIDKLKNVFFSVLQH